MTSRQTIIALHLEGKTYGQISRATGLSRGSVGGHIARWRKEHGGEPSKTNGLPWTMEDTRLLAALAHDRMSYANMSVALGRSQHAIKSRLEFIRSGGLLDPKLPPRDPEWAAEIRRADKRFVRLLAEAFLRGDHLPKIVRAA